MDFLREETIEVWDCLDATSAAIIAYRNKLIETLSARDDIDVEDIFQCDPIDHATEIGRLHGEISSLWRTISELKSRFHNVNSQTYRKTKKYENYIRSTLE